MLPVGDLEDSHWKLWLLIRSSSSKSSFSLTDVLLMERLRRAESGDCDTRTECGIGEGVEWVIRFSEMHLVHFSKERLLIIIGPPP